MGNIESITLLQLNNRIKNVIGSNPSLSNVWVVAETSDVRCNGSHCYLELIEKDPNCGHATARIRATIWANRYNWLAQKFLTQTGQNFTSDIKVLVQGSVSFHESFGVSFNITDIDGSYTLGDLQRRRYEYIRRLQAEGIYEMNRNLSAPVVPQRIAVISAGLAAGYGDFIKQLYGSDSNPQHIRITTKLFPALMQGESAPQSIIAALDSVLAEIDKWDMVVIIRGGGATSDFIAFENYELAAHVCQFPLPIFTGIGHERDTTLLDYVANASLKTPTAVAQCILGFGVHMLKWLERRSSQLLQITTDSTDKEHQRLSLMAGALPQLANTALMRAKERLNTARLTLSSVTDRRILPQKAILEGRRQVLADALRYAIVQRRQQLEAKRVLVDALSPQSTLRRGYSITRVNGKAVRDTDTIPDGAILETTLASGTLLSVKTSQPSYKTNQSQNT